MFKKKSQKAIRYIPLAASIPSSQIMIAQHSSSFDGRSKHMGSSIGLPFLNIDPEHLGSHIHEPDLQVHRWSHPLSIVSLIWKEVYWDNSQWRIKTTAGGDGSLF